MTKMEFVKMELAFGKDYYTKYHTYKTVEYKYRGEFRTRKELVMTEEGKALNEMLSKESENHLFTCPCCGKKVQFDDLEAWIDEDRPEDFINDEVICSLCYEDEMGEDL